MEAVSSEFQYPISGSNMKYKVNDVFLELSLMSLVEIGDNAAYQNF